jgi:hypothetical protein
MFSSFNKARLGILLTAIICRVLNQTGGARSASHADAQQSEPVKHRALSPEDAAVLAAKLANKDCEHRYKRQPFKAGQHMAILKDGFYHWGKLDVGGIGGSSAVVTFRKDGSEPHVEVYFSSDSLIVR